MGWSTREPSGRWTAAYRGPDGQGGRRVFKAGGFLNKKAADAWWKDEEAKLRGGTWLDPRAGEIPLREYFQRFYARKEQQGREAETLRDYRKTAERYLFPTFGDTPLNEVSKFAVWAWRDGLIQAGAGPATLRRAWGLLAQLMRRAVIEDRIPRTPCVEADLPPVPPKSQLVLDRFQLEDLAEAIGARVPRHRALVYTLGYAGLRIGEASALIRDRVDLRRCEIQVLQSRKRDGSVGDTKTHQQRTVVIPGALRDRLTIHLNTFVGPQPDALVFTAAGRVDQGWAHAGGPLNPQNFQQRIFTQGLVDAGLDRLGATLPKPRLLTPHDLRDTCATLLIEGGADLYEVMKYLGHRSIQVTERHYAHLVEARKRRTAAALDEIMRSAADARGNVVRLR